MEPGIDYLVGDSPPVWVLVWMLRFGIFLSVTSFVAILLDVSIWGLKSRLAIGRLAICLMVALIYISLLADWLDAGTRWAAFFSRSCTLLLLGIVFWDRFKPIKR